MKQKILLAGALLLVLVQPADAVELYAVSIGLAVEW